LDHHTSHPPHARDPQAQEVVSRGTWYTGRVGTMRPQGSHSGRAVTSRLALARVHFLQEQATGSPCTAHDAVIFIGDPIISTYRCLPGRAVLWPQEHIWAACAGVHPADAAQVREGALAGVCIGGQESGAVAACTGVTCRGDCGGWCSPQGPSNFLKMCSWRAQAWRSSWHSLG
jgi:hypothetical protein